eukprot:5258589-Pleurochrysis_carterae.AAC.1
MGFRAVDAAGDSHQRWARVGADPRPLVPIKDAAVRAKATPMPLYAGGSGVGLEGPTGCARTTRSG